MIATYKDIKGETGLLAKREPFKGNSLRAAWYLWPTQPAASGRLSELDSDILQLDWIHSIASDTPLYVVYSYETPIAWAIEGQNAYCTPQKFSSTTSRGQSVVRQWIDYTLTV